MKLNESLWKMQCEWLLLQLLSIYQTVQMSSGHYQCQTNCDLLTQPHLMYDNSLDLPTQEFHCAVDVICKRLNSDEQCTLPDPIRLSSGKYKRSFVDMKVRQIVNLCMGRIRLPGKPIGCTYHDINQACPYILAKSFGTVELTRQQLT